jgi:hypothetical protein
MYEVLKYLQQKHKHWLYKGTKYITVTENKITDQVNEFNNYLGYQIPYLQ